MARTAAVTDNVIVGESSGNGNNAPSPSGSVSSDGAVIIDPAELSNDNGADGSGGSGTGSDGTRKRRGPKPGSKRTAKAAPLTVTGLEMLLLSVHTSLAAMTGESALAINETQAKALATAGANVQRHYPSIISEKAMDWGNLAIVAGTIYSGIAFSLYNTRRKQAPKEAPLSAMFPPAGERLMP